MMSMAPGLKWGCACADCGGRRVGLCMCGWPLWDVDREADMQVR